MTEKKSSPKTYFLRKIQDEFKYLDKVELLREIKGKENIQTMCNLKAGDIVCIKKARPRRKYKRPDKEKYYSSGKYFKVAAANDLYGCFLTVNSDKKIKREDEERARLMVDGYKTSDLFDLSYFMFQNFPKMLDDFIRNYKRIVSEKDKDYSEVTKTIEELKAFLEKYKDKDVSILSDKEADTFFKESHKVWSNFGKVFYGLWI